MNYWSRAVIIAYSTVGLAGNLLCLTAHAEESGLSARQLFKEARRLVSEGNYNGACPRFEKSLALEPGIGTQFNLADCWEHVGRSASARELFLTVAEAASEKGENERARLATERVVALATKLSRLQIKYDHTGVELRVTRDGTLVERDDWNRPTAVDPGHYSVELRSNGKKKWGTEVDVPARALTVLVTGPTKAKSGQEVNEYIEASAPIEPVAAHELASGPYPAPPAAQAEQMAPRQAKQGSSLWPSIAIIAGIGGVATGTVFALIYQSKNEQAKKICPSNVGCSNYDISQHSSYVSSAQTARVGAYLGFGLGTASIAAATVYFATRPSRRESPPSVSFDISPVVEPGRQPFVGAAAKGIW